MSGDRHNSNVELLAQGVANLVVPFVRGIRLFVLWTQGVPERFVRNNIFVLCSPVRINAIPSVSFEHMTAQWARARLSQRYTLLTTKTLCFKIAALLIENHRNSRLLRVATSLYE